jgi:hypothetical protein
MNPVHILTPYLRSILILPPANAPNLGSRVTFLNTLFFFFFFLRWIVVRTLKLEDRHISAVRYWYLETRSAVVRYQRFRGPCSLRHYTASQPRRQLLLPSSLAYKDILLKPVKCGAIMHPIRPFLDNGTILYIWKAPDHLTHYHPMCRRLEVRAISYSMITINFQITLQVTVFKSHRLQRHKNYCNAFSFQIKFAFN